MSVSLYRQYRPQTFKEVVGQAAAIDVLSHALAHSRVGHAYLFSGPRGCGKTSAARILAKALNCLSPDGIEPCCKCKNCLAIAAGENLDVVEIDGASNNSVDEVRELKSHVALAPFSSKYKVYIIDEVHMLSTAAFNALLKTLEEPPSHVVFIMATTEPHKVPVTIRSRCQHIPFHSIGAGEIFGQLEKICGRENVPAQPEALWELARQADGALRDALSMLEQVINRASGELTLNDVEATLGAGSRPALERWFAGLRSNDASTWTGLKAMLDSGASGQRLFEELFSLVRTLWLSSRWPDIVDALDISEQEKKFAREEVPHWTPAKLKALLNSIVKIITQARLGVRGDVLLGVFMLELTRVLDGGSAPEEREDRESENNKAQALPAGPAVPERRVVTERAAVPARFPVPEQTKRPDTREREQAQIERPPAAQAGPSLFPEDTAGPGAPVELPSLNWQSLTKEAEAGLLAQAQAMDFALYCALLDAKFLEAEGHLLLDMGHAYCYEVLRLERNSAELAALSGQDHANGIFLRCRDEVSVCSPAARGLEPSLSPGAGSVRGSGPGRKKNIPDESVPVPVPGHDHDLQGEQGHLPSSGKFNDLMDSFSRMLGGEVVLVRRAVPEEDIPDDGAGDEDSGSDSENDAD